MYHVTQQQIIMHAIELRLVLPPAWKGGADTLAALAELLGCPSWGSWVNKMCSCGVSVD
jgi:hypothetical protein